jgi:hypothetical protein
MKEPQHRTPSSYRSLEQVAPGARAEIYADFVWRADPVADAVIAPLYEFEKHSAQPPNPFFGTRDREVQILSPDQSKSQENHRF